MGKKENSRPMVTGTSGHQSPFNFFMNTVLVSFKSDSCAALWCWPRFILH